MSDKSSDTNKPTANHEMVRVILTAAVNAFVATVIMRLFSMPWLIIIILLLFISVTWIWHQKGNDFPCARGLIYKIVRILLPFIFLFLILSLILFVSPTRDFIFGSHRLQGVVTGIQTPISDFSWCTNGTVVATPMKGFDDDVVIKIEMTLRGDKPYADAGWGMDLLGWNWLKLSFTHKPWFHGKNEISFYIRGEKGGEKVGVSMKSDREFSGPSGAASDEEKVPLDSLGVLVDTSWRQVRIPLHRFYNVDPRRIRNVAFYTDASLMKSVGDTQIIYLKQITFQ